MAEIEEEVSTEVADWLSTLPGYITEENEDDKYDVPPLEEGPWLIATHENQKLNKLEKQTFRTNSNTYIKTIHQLDQNTILGSSQGWLILRQREDYDFYLLWNPVTYQFLWLPELLSDDINFSHGLLTESLDLDNNPETCKFVLFFEDGIVFSCRPTRRSDNCCWVKQSIELDGISSVEITVVCVFEGIIYGTAYGRIENPVDENRWAETFVRIDDVGQDSSSLIRLVPMGIDLPDSKINFHDYARWNRMLECCGMFYFIHIMFQGTGEDATSDIIKVLVWRLDFSEMEWIRVESLSNRAFLVECGGCTWCWAGRGFIQENCIYIARPNDDERVYSYNLEDDSSTYVLPHSTSLQAFSGPYWFMPPNQQRLLPGCEGNQVKIDKETEDIQEQVEEDTYTDTDTTQELSSGKLLSELPVDMLQSIAKSMILSDYMNFRLTCKSLHQANPLPECRDNGQYPLLMIYKDFRKTYEVLDPFENVSSTISALKQPAEIISAFDHYKDGWLLLNSGHYLEYLNPFTKEAGKYPPCQLTFTRFGFSTCPTSPDCLTVGMMGDENNLRIGCFDAAVGEWEYYETEFSSDTNLKFVDTLKIGPKYHKNAFYSLRRDGCIGELKFIEGKVCWKVYKYPFEEETSFNSYYLVEVDGELVSVFIGEYGSWVKVFKFDTLDKHWLELDTLGEHVLFLSPSSSSSIKTKKSEMRNRIYFPRFKDNKIIFYSLDTGKYHTSSGANSMDDFHGTKAQLFCCWVNLSL